MFVSALQCRVRMIGVSTCFIHVKVMPQFSSLGGMTSLVVSSLLTYAQKVCTEMHMQQS